MKTTRSTIQIIFVVLLLGYFFNASAKAIKIDDVKVGSTITSEGIDIGGYRGAGNLPVPEGEWEVIDRIYWEKNYNEKVAKYPRVILKLLNKDLDSNIQFIQIQINTRPGNTIFGVNPCLVNENIIATKVGTESNHRINLCARAVEIMDISIYNDPDDTQFNTRTLTSGGHLPMNLDKNDYYKKLLKRFSDSKSLRIELTGSMMFGYTPKYNFLIKTPFKYNNIAEIKAETYSVELGRWLENSGGKLKEFYEGRQVTFEKINFEN